MDCLGEGQVGHLQSSQALFFMTCRGLDLDRMQSGGAPETCLRLAVRKPSS